MANALEAASLVMIPSGYEDGTLGSLKPTDGTGDFTFSRGSNLSATRINEQGYIEKGYENLLYPSNDFSGWSNINSILTPNQAGYDGSNDAWLLEATSAQGRRYKSISDTGVLTYSIYAKSGTADILRLRIDAATDMDLRVDLSNGSFVSGTFIDYNIEDAGNGWWRVSVTQNITSPVYIFVYSYDVGSIYIQDVMLNQGLVAYPYIETTTAPVAGGILEDMPRLDWSGSCPSLLLEPSRTNELPNSEYFEAGTLSNATLSLSGTSLENVTNAYALTENTANAEHYWISEQMTTATNNNLVSTIFVKPNGRTKIKLWNYHLANQMSLVDIDLTTNTTSNGGGTNVTFVSANVTDYSNGWKRVEIQSIKSASTYPYRIRVNLLDDNGSDVYAGDGTSGVLIYGAQMEQDTTYPTSYIPTYGVSQTRLEDLATDSGDATTFNDTEGTLYAEASWFDESGAMVLFSVNSGNITDRIRFGRFGGNLRVIASKDGTNFINVQPIALSANTNYKIAFRYKENDFAVYVNGLSVYTNNSASTWDNGDLISGDLQGGTGGAEMFGKVKQVLYFPTALSDSECIALTTI